MYCRRREGISRDTIPEGVNGSNWRPQADSIVWQGDEDSQYREKQKFSEMGFPYKPDNESNGQVRPFYSKIGPWASSQVIVK
jgi:hypothetical protein